MNMLPAHLHVDVVGHGYPILCLSGFGCSNWIFERMAHANRHRACFVMPDNRGMGQSPKVEEPYDIDDLARDGLAVMNALGHEQFAVIGISMGGFIAQSLCLQQPQRVSRLVLLCTSGPGSDFEPLVQITREQIVAFYQMPADQQAELSLTKTTAPSFRERDPAGYNYVLRARRQHVADVGQVILQYDAVGRFLRSTLDLSAIHHPTLIMTGDRDRTVPMKNTKNLASVIPHARYEVVEDSDHLFFLERADQTYDALFNFLEGL